MVRFQFEWLLRILSSLFVGSMIGYERYSRSKEAGVRTHSIVAIGSCILMLVSMYAFPEGKNDPARVAAQVVSGVGFLGAGIIFVQRGTIHGLTTAAGIWATSALGLCFGAGMYEVGFIGTFLVFALQMFFPRFFEYSPPRNILKLLVHLKEDGSARDVNEALSALNLNHTENVISSDAGRGWKVETMITSHRDVDPKILIEELRKSEKIIDAEIL